MRRAAFTSAVSPLLVGNNFLSSTTVAPGAGSLNKIYMSRNPSDLTVNGANRDGTVTNIIYKARTSGAEQIAFMTGSMSSGTNFIVRSTTGQISLAGIQNSYPVSLPCQKGDFLAVWVKNGTAVPAYVSRTGLTAYASDTSYSVPPSVGTSVGISTLWLSSADVTLLGRDY